MVRSIIVGTTDKTWRTQYLDAEKSVSAKKKF